MNLTVHEILVSQFSRSLEALKSVLQKGHAYADHKKIDFTVLLQTRLVPDQFPLSRQIQIASDSAKMAAAKLAGITPPVFEDKEQTYDEFVARIDKTIAFLRTIKPEQFSDFEKRTITFSFRPGGHFEGRAYLVQHAIPNFYFHMRTAYDILRASGVEIGKADYLGNQDWKVD